MPRRIYTYPIESGWGGLNLLSSFGALLFAFSFVVFLWNIVQSLRAGAFAGDNPWDAAGLEWATSSPPPPQNFDRIPFVTSRELLWAERDSLPVVTGLAVDRRQILVTTVAEGKPDIRERSPDPTIWPLVSAIFVGALFIGSIFTPWAVVWGALPVSVALILWFWPKRLEEEER
jgi:cytochrome c oxidase subunit 1